MDTVSRTAVWVAAARALGAREPDIEVRNPDYLAERLLGDLSQYDVDVPVIDALAGSYEDAMLDPETAGMVRAMTVRSRFIDDALERAVDEGAEQVLILGAGFDSHAYRFEEMLRDVRVYELDRPATLAKKRQRVEQALGGAPGNLVYVPVDFVSDAPADTLVADGYDFSRRSFVIMEGLTMYLTEESLRDTLALVASHSSGGSIVFDFVTSAMVAALRQVDLSRVPDAARPFMQRFLNLIRDEPFQFGFPLGEERSFIESSGFEVRELLVLDGDEAVRRYLTRADGTQVGEEGIARQPPIPPEMARARRETMSYRICEALIPRKH
jgi:methyltransferase (TIGR00027 family)